MRISTSMVFDAGIASMQQQSAGLLRTQQQVASGKRVLTPADDPIAASQALVTQQSQAVNDGYLGNQKSAAEALGLSENTLVSTGDLIASVRTLVVQAGNAGLSQSDRQSIATNLRARFDTLLGLANGADAAGQYLFSGYMGDTKPFSGSVETAAAGEIAYAGDDGQRLQQVSASRQLAVSDSGRDIFMRIRSGNGTFATAATATNSGTGLIDAGSVTGSFVSDTYTISFAPAGSGLNYTVTGATSGVVATGAYVGGQAIAFNGASVTISGTPAATDTFTVAPSTSQSLFKTLANAITALESASTTSAAGNTALSNNLGAALTNLDQAHDNVLRVRAAIGSRMNEIDALGSAGEDLNLQYQQTLSRLQDLDYAAAISRLTQQQMNLEAAQKSFERVSGLSLFNYL